MYTCLNYYFIYKYTYTEVYVVWTKYFFNNSIDLIFQYIKLLAMYNFIQCSIL